MTGDGQQLPWIFSRHLGFVTGGFSELGSPTTQPRPLAVVTSRKWDETTLVTKLSSIPGARMAASVDTVHTLVHSQRLVVVFPNRPVLREITSRPPANAEDPGRRSGRLQLQGCRMQGWAKACRVCCETASCEAACCTVAGCRL